MWKKANCWQKKQKKSKQLVKMLSVLQSGKINYQTLLLFSTIRKRSPCSAFWLRTQQQIPWELPVMTSGRCYKNKREQTAKLSTKWEADMLSLRMALSLKCTRLVFTKILWSSVCFNTFQGFVFLGRIRYEFLKVSATWSSTRGRRQAITWAALNAPRWSRALNDEPCFVIQWERVLFKSHQRSQSRLDVRLVSAATVNHSLHYFSFKLYLPFFPPLAKKLLAIFCGNECTNRKGSA